MEYICPDPEASSYTKALLMNEAVELAEALGKVVIQDGFDFSVCEPDGSGCMPIIQWYDSICAVCSVSDRFVRNYNLIQQYGFRQTFKFSCWAATAAIAWAIQKSHAFANEEYFFHLDINAELPTESFITSFVNHIQNGTITLFSASEAAVANRFRPLNNTVPERVKFCANISPVMLDKFLNFYLDATTAPSLKQVKRIKIHSYLTLFKLQDRAVEDIFLQNGQRVGISRLRKDEKKFYTNTGFACTEVPFQDFTPEKLTALLQGGKRLLTFLYADALYLHGKHLQTLLTQISQLPMGSGSQSYMSHAILVLDYCPETDHVFILNTLPANQQSVIIPACAANRFSPSSANSAQLCVMDFLDFREALISDVKTCARSFLADGINVDNQALSTIPFYHCSAQPQFYRP